MNTWPARICTCRYSGRYQANFDTPRGSRAPSKPCRSQSVAAAPSPAPRHRCSRGSIFGTGSCAVPADRRRRPAPRSRLADLCRRRAARARRRVRLDHLLAARQVLGQRPMLRLAFWRGLAGGSSRAHRRSPARRHDAGGEIVQFERKLLGEINRRAAPNALPKIIF